MHINTKIFSALLFILSQFLFSNDLTFVIPKSYVNTLEPLPPFPLESVSNLDTTETLLTVGFPIRTWRISNIGYNYYYMNPMDLSKNPFSISIDASYINKDISGGINYTDNNKNIGVKVSYLDSINPMAFFTSHHLPISLGIEASPLEYSTNIWAKYYSYNNILRFKTGFYSLAPIAKISYRNRYPINQFLELEYKNGILDLFGGIGYNSKRIKTNLGVYTNLATINPYIEFSSLLNSFVCVDIMTMDKTKPNYYMTLGYLNDKYIKIGGGIDLTDSVTPYFILKDSFIFGDKTLVISPSLIKFDLSFIKSKFTSIIFLEINSMSAITFGLKINYFEVFND